MVRNLEYPVFPSKRDLFLRVWEHWMRESPQIRSRSSSVADLSDRKTFRPGLPARSSWQLNNLGGAVKSFLYQSCKRETKKVFVQGHPMPLGDLGVSDISQSTCSLVWAVSPPSGVAWLVEPSKETSSCAALMPAGSRPSRHLR